MKSMRVRFDITFEVDLDPVEGWGHQEKDWADLIIRQLNDNSYKSCVKRVVSQPSDYVWEYIEKESRWNLVPIKESEAYNDSTISSDERASVQKFIDIAWKQKKLHPVPNPSWIKNEWNNVDPDRVITLEDRKPPAREE